METKSKKAAEEKDLEESIIIKTISNILNEIISENKENSKKVSDNNKTVKYAFVSKKPPSITIEAYLQRILKYTKIETSTLIITLIYIDKICDINNILLSPVNIHRIIISCLILSIKYNEDDYYSNEFYAKVAGVSLQEINALEFECLNLLEHSLYVHWDIFENYEKYLKQYSK